MIQTVRVPGGEGRAAMVSAGQSFRVVDVDGGQVGDLFAFAAADPGEFASAEHTRVAIAKLFPQPGDPVLTNRRRPILVAAEDTSPRRHDMLYAACDPARYALLGATAPHPLVSRPASSRPGDYIAFRAAQDCLVVLSSCPMDIVAISSGGITPLELQVYDAASG